MQAKLFFIFIFLISFIQNLTAVPTVNSVSPTNGNISGGNAITLSGSGFTGVTSVYLGTRPATSFIFVNDNTITTTVPTGTVGTVNVIVTAGSPSLPTPNNYYTYTTPFWQGIVSGTTPDQVGIFRTDTNTFYATIPLPAVSLTSVINPDGMPIYTGNSNPPGVTVIDAATNTIITTIPTSVGPGAFDGAVNPSGTRFYVTNFNAGFLTVIDTTTNTVVTNIALSPLLGNVSVNPDGLLVYVGNFDGTLTVIDAATNTIMSSIFVGVSPGKIAIFPDGTKAYIPILQSNYVAVLDLATLTITNTIPVGAQPYGAAILPNKTTLYVVNIADSTVSVIDIATETVTGTIALPDALNPFWITATPDSKTLYIINEVNDEVTPIDVATNTVGTPFGGISGNLQDIVTSPDPAPVAYFSATPQIARSPTSFDASASLSPVGTIAFYAWDFGDGTTVTTASPFINHTYLNPGAFNVTLTVTNSAGTSTTKIFSSRTMSQNGGPTATRTEVIQSLLAPPTQARGFQKWCKYPSQTDIVNEIEWNPIWGGSTISYKICRDSLTNLIAVVPGTGPFKYFDHNLQKNKSYTYYIFAVNTSGVMSTPAVITIPPKK